MSSSVLFVHGLSGKLFSNHVSEDTHHGGTSVVDLGVQLASLLSGVKDVSSEVTNSVVTIVLGSGPPGNLNESNEGKDLGKSSSGNGGNSGHTSGNIRELQVVGRGNVSAKEEERVRFVALRVILISWNRLFFYSLLKQFLPVEDNVVVVDDGSNNGSHGNTSVLSLNSPTTFEGLGLSVDPSKRIEDSEGLGGSNFELIDLQGGGGLSIQR